MKKITVFVSNQTTSWIFIFKCKALKSFINYHVSLWDKFLCCRLQSCVFDNPIQRETNILNHKQYFIPIVDIIRLLFLMLSVYSAVLSNVYHVKMFKRCIDVQLCIRSRPNFAKML